MYLEFGLLPVRYVVKEKRLNFLRYILNESMTSMIRRVYETLKTDSRKGDFVFLVSEDISDLEIDMSEGDISKMSKYDWKVYVHGKVRHKALQKLSEENSTKSKTKHIRYEALEMRRYLYNNINTYLTKTIFSVRAGTIDLKCFNEWKYESDKCVMCDLVLENLDHFMSCKEYGHGNLTIDWKEIFLDDVVNQNKIAKEVKRRLFIRKTKLEKVGLPTNVAPLLQDPVER